MTPRLNKELSQKLHDAGIVVESEDTWQPKELCLVPDLWKNPKPINHYVDWMICHRGGGPRCEGLVFPAPTLQELLMTKEARAMRIQLSVDLDNIGLEWDGKETRESNWDELPDWQSATDYVAELLLKNKVG